MIYQTVFDLETAGYKSWPLGIVPLIFAAVGVALYLKPELFKSNRRKANLLTPREAGTFLTVIGSAFALMFYASSYGEYRELLGKLRSGEYQVAEGIVANFHPMPATGHSMETFDVGNAHFKYSDYVVDAGFNNAASHGGPLKPGLHVRILYSGNHILRLQIASD